MSDNNRHFTAVVVGDNPEEIMKKYDSNVKVEPYALYKFSEVKKYKENTLRAYRSIVDNKDMPDSIREEYKEKVQDVENMDDIEFYMELVDGLDVDEKTGDVMSDINPNGKYDACKIGKDLTVPLIDHFGEELYQARKKDIDWGRIHFNNKDVYTRAWEMVMEGSKPTNEQEEVIYENMKNREKYFSFFETKENYVINSTAFWGYAFVTDSEWIEMDDRTTQTDWIGQFYDRFIKPLPEDSLITMYWCLRK